MPIRCTFDLNKERVSTLNCPGFGTIPAFPARGARVTIPRQQA